MTGERNLWQTDPEPQGELDPRADPEAPIEPTPEPVPEPAHEPLGEPKPEPMSEPMPEPPTEPMPEPVHEPPAEPAPEPVHEPPAEPAPEPAPELPPEPMPAPEPTPPPTMRAPAPGQDAPLAAEQLVAPRSWLRHGQRAWIPLGPGDRPRVEVGETVTPITVVAERVRDRRLVMLNVSDRQVPRFPPGSTIGPRDVRARRRNPLTDDATVLFQAPHSRLGVVVGRERESLYARADGTVVSVTPGGISLLLEGPTLAGVAAAGQPVHGRLRIAVGDPGDELRSAGLHVADAGSIVVAGARVDVETLTRARALGIHGVIAGGMAGHDVRSFSRSEARQQAALHPLPPFAVLILEGFGRRSLAGPPWDLLVAAAGSSVSIFPDPPLLVFGSDASLAAVPPGTLRIATGPGAGTVGTIDGPATMHRFAEGVHVLAVPFVGGGRRWIVALADLERFQ